MAPKRISTSAALAMTEATIKKQVSDSVTAALEVGKELLASSAGLNELNWYFLIATVLRTAK
ncbi:hypothetical protein Tco_0314306, partial [Tanacetum coccineum]